MYVEEVYYAVLSPERCEMKGDTDA